MLNITNFYTMVKEQKIDEIMDLFGEQPLNINTPIEGQIQTEVELQAYSLRFSNWMDLHNLEINQIGETKEEPYHAGEFVITNNEFELPIALVVEYGTKEDEEDEVVTTSEVVSIRDYHSMWPLEGMHRLRDPILQVRYDLDEPEPVETYMEALAGGDIEEILRVCSDDAYFREPSGSDYRYEGRDALKEMYSKILRDGGIELLHCNVIDNDTTCAIEFIAQKWGKTQLPPQAGIAFYDYNHSTITAARVYDDVEPPL